MQHTVIPTSSAHVHLSSPKTLTLLVLLRQPQPRHVHDPQHFLQVDILHSTISDGVLGARV